MPQMIREATRSIGPLTPESTAQVQKKPRANARQAMSAAKIAENMIPTDMPGVTGSRDKTPAPKAARIPSAPPQTRKPKVLLVDLLQTPELQKIAGGLSRSRSAKPAPKRQANKGLPPPLLETMEGLKA
mgnify:CR=1 FL=1